LECIIYSDSLSINSLFLDNAFKNRNNYTNKLTVTGLSFQDFINDLIVWRGSFYGKSMNQNAAESILIIES